MFTLQNFENHINATILKRGIQYYQSGNVVYVEETEDNLWEAEVDGSETYLVEIQVQENGLIDEYSCDCPYDGGTTCKHVVAVLYAIREEMKSSKTLAKEKPPKKITFEELLKKVNLVEYQSFVRHQASKDREFKTEFELYFAEKDDRINIAQKYSDLLKKIIRKHSADDYIDYRASSRLASEVDGLIKTGYEFLNKKNPKDAFELAKVVLKEMMQVIIECDDSSGSIEGILYATTELITDITQSDHIAKELSEHVYDFLQIELSDKTYFNFGDFGYKLFHVFVDMAIKLDKSKAFLAFIDARVSTLTGKYDNYQREFFQKQKIEFYEAIGKHDEVEKLIEQNLEIVEVRQGVVNRAIDTKDYPKAKKLINDGIAIADKLGHPGTVSKWEKELLRIADLDKDIVEIRRHNQHFALDKGFDATYYRQWKKTYDETEWKQVIDTFISQKIEDITKANELNKGKNWYKAMPPFSHQLAAIYLEEMYWEKLLAMVKADGSLGTAIQYKSYLLKLYPYDLLDIYLPAFELLGDKAGNRGEYEDLVQKMKIAIQDIPEGKQKIINIAQKLKEKYLRRPAMVEELNKILKL